VAAALQRASSAVRQHDRHLSAVATTLFLGGWLPPFPNATSPALAWLHLGFLPPGLAGVLWFSLKVFAFLFVYIWFRGTFPRYRFDQLMDLGWKWMIPLSLANLFLVGALKLWLAKGGRRRQTILGRILLLDLLAGLG
jgi:NADH-quinone oxidoreductase subunit H